MDKKFFEWLDAHNFEFISVYNRYGYKVGKGYIVFGGEEILEDRFIDLVEDIGGDDLSALAAMKTIFMGEDVFYGVNENPQKAMEYCIKEIYDNYQERVIKANLKGFSIEKV